MISLKLGGRAGNQIFQYCYVQKYINENCPREIMNVSVEYLKEKKTDNTSFINVLDQFNINEINIIDKINYTLKQRILDYYYRMLIKLIRINAKIKKRALRKKDYEFVIKLSQKILNENGLYYYIPGMKEFYKSKSNNIIFFRQL